MNPHGVNQPTYYNWKNHYSGMSDVSCTSEIKRWTVKRKTMLAECQTSDHGLDRRLQPPAMKTFGEAYSIPASPAHLNPQYSSLVLK